MSTVRDTLMTGVRVTKGFLSIIYKITDAFIDCEHFFTEKVCCNTCLIYLGNFGFKSNISEISHPKNSFLI